MQGTFGHFNVKQMVLLMTSPIRIMVSQFEQLMNDSPDGSVQIEVTGYLSRLALDIIGRVAFDYDFNALTENAEMDLLTIPTLKTPRNTRIAWAYATLFENVAMRITLADGFLPLHRFIPYSHRPRINLARRIIKDIPLEVVRERIQDKDRICREWIRLGLV
jgi:hypothetical protein